MEALLGVHTWKAEYLSKGIKTCFYAQIWTATYHAMNVVPSLANVARFGVLIAPDTPE
jgi:hypothetical protein